MVGNCDKFHFVEEGQGCNDVLSQNGITLAQLFAWNPQVRNDCSGMWAEVYLCVSSTDHTPSMPTTTAPGNGIATPTPIQDGMVSNCDAFHFVVEGQGCNDVLTKNGITLAQLFAWNPGRQERLLRNVGQRLRLRVNDERKLNPSCLPS
jgi:hypothetical protein